MLLPRPATFLVAGLATGALLATISLFFQFSVGWIGAAGLEPSAPERILWLRLCGTALVLGHIVTAIVLVGNNLRVGSGNTLAMDSWILVAGWQVATWLFRRDRRERDERHEVIAARGYRAGYYASIVLLLPLIAWLAFTPRPWRTFFSDFVIANVLIALLIAAYAALLFVQLLAYARDTR